MTKAYLFGGLLFYLFMSSFLISLTFTEIGSENYWIPNIGPSIPTYTTDFSESGNISDYNIQINKGSWVIESGALVSKDLKNEFWVTSKLGTAPIITYNISNFNSLTRIYVFINSKILKSGIAYFELDPSKNLILAVKEETNIFGLSKDKIIIGSIPFTFSKTDYIIQTDASLEGTFLWILGIPDIPATLTIDGQEILFAYFKDIGTGAVKPHYSGIYTEQPNLRINILSSIEKIKPQTDVKTVLDYLTLMGQIILYIPPPIIMPIWLNFIQFKIPLGMAIWIGAEMLRGI